MKQARKNPDNKFNWVIQLKKFFFEPCGLTDFGERIGSESFDLDGKRFLNRFKYYLRDKDVECCRLSRSLLIYHDLSLRLDTHTYILCAMYTA